LSYKFLEHTTDAVIEVIAPNLIEAFRFAGQAVVETTINLETVKEIEERKLLVKGKDLRYLLFNWAEEVIYQLITEGFAIHRFELEISKNSEYKLVAVAFGEPMDISKHHFKVEIKAPTFHEMEVLEGDQVKLKFLLDL
jgi:SHS2 domain-containing protein